MTPTGVLPLPEFYPHFIVIRHGDLWTVEAFISLDHPVATGWFGDGRRCLIGGEAAQLLYLCLGGHRFGTPGRQADPQIAWQARAHLAAIAPTPGGYWLAHRVVLHWGPDVWPEMKREERFLWRV